SSVGVAGSVLGGATGWLSRAFGHGLDNLLSVELVTAAGDVETASADENAELFWGLRGAGHNLGVVTSVELALHPVGPVVLAGQIIYPFDEAERLLRVFRDVIADAGDGFQCLPFTFRVPPIDAFPAETHGQPVLDFIVFALDDDAARSIERLRGLAKPIMDAVEPMPYSAVQQSFDANLPAGQRYYSTAHDIEALTDAAIADFARFVRTSVGAFTATYLEPKGGAAGRVDARATAMGGRSAACEFHVIAGWMDETDDEAVLSWAHDFSRTMTAHSTGGVYVNLIGDDERARVSTAFSDVDRVRALKRVWDPENVLRANNNVTP
ncbi:MAG: BBE domain-containing protein, partial [Rubrivivax sp.]